MAGSIIDFYYKFMTTELVVESWTGLVQEGYGYSNMHTKCGREISRQDCACASMLQQACRITIIMKCDLRQKRVLRKALFMLQAMNKSSYCYGKMLAGAMWAAWTTCTV